MSFQLDTSGVVQMPPRAFQDVGLTYRWTDLSPFAQGYVEAMFADYQARVHGDADAGLAFSDLSPSALALILKDCEALSKFYAQSVGGGQKAWADRQSGEWPGFPLLLPSLDEEGKVQLSVKGG